MNAPPHQLARIETEPPALAGVFSVNSANVFGGGTQEGKPSADAVRVSGSGRGADRECERERLEGEEPSTWAVTLDGLSAPTRREPAPARCSMKERREDLIPAPVEVVDYMRSITEAGSCGVQVVRGRRLAVAFISRYAC